MGRSVLLTRSKPSGVFMPSNLAPPVIDERNVRLKRCRHGWMVYYQNDAYIGRSFDLYGEFANFEVDAFEQLIPKGGVAVDIGANIGAHTVPMARIVGDSGRVIAFEPQRVVHQLLCANVALNALHNVWTFCAGSGREPGVMRVPPLDYNHAGNFGGISISSGDVGEIVQILPLDAVNLPACHFIKIDVEGMECEVIAGAHNVIAKWRPLLYVENDRPEKSAQLVSDILALDYRLYWHVTALFNPANFFGTAENVFGRVSSFNMLCIPRERAFTVQGLREITSPDESSPPVD